VRRRCRRRRWRIIAQDETREVVTGENREGGGFEIEGRCRAAVVRGRGQADDGCRWEGFHIILGSGAGAVAGWVAVRAVRGGFGFSPFFLELPWYFFRFRCMQVKPQKRKELCGGREGQTAYYVERKALRCGARKATLIEWNCTLVR
jgi:hypothetical protein